MIFLNWELLLLTHNPLWLAGGLILQSAPILWVGTFGEGWARTWTSGQLGAIRVFVLLLLLLGWLTLPTSIKPWLLIITAFIEGGAGAVIIPRIQALIPQMVSHQEIATANAWMELTSRLPRLIGPLLAGLLLTILSPLATLILIILGYALGFWGLTKLPKQHPVVKKQAKEIHLLSSMAMVGKDAWLTTALAVRGVMNFLWPAFSLGAPFLVHQTWHASAFGYGLLLGSAGVAGLIGTVLSARFHNILPYLYYPAWALIGLSFWFVSHAPNIAMALIPAFISGIASPTVHVALDTHIAKSFAHQSLGQIFAFQRLVMSLLNMMGTYVIGVMLNILPAPTVLSSAAYVFVVASTIGFMATYGSTVIGLKNKKRSNVQE